ncbi:MAG TPA: hypothetical protein VLH19_00945 [Patescibacteria group bacterium]|nr:hypothetical protein [Patescibacteria group bacterium]
MTSKLSDPSLAIVFAYAPAGLGHLRVSDALRHGPPESSEPILLPARGESIRVIHRFTSLNPYARGIMEWAQSGVMENIITKIYRRILLSDAKELEEQLFEILKQRVELPKTLLLVASHFGIAHQIGAMKRNLAERAGVKVLVVMQVTDDSPQHIWYVPGTDITFVPSEYTKEALTVYGKQSHLPPVHFEVLPYPLSPELSKHLSSEAYQKRLEQYDPKKQTPVSIAVPISGAAVGVNFAVMLLMELHKLSSRYHFSLVAKRNVFADVMLERVEHLPYVQTSTSHSDRQIVELYESAYTQNVISLEVTKPSEQSFKAMLHSREVGGAILLFSTPVGRQEYDNLKFLQRHQLIPTSEEQTLLFAQQNPLLEIAKHWRGIRIPDDPIAAAKFIFWCHEQKIFQAMAGAHAKADDINPHEVGDDGVAKFWKRVEELL